MSKAIIQSVVLFLVACSSNKKLASSNASGMPPCLVTKIQNILNDPKQSPPQSVTQCTFKGQTVYYVTAPCCDQYNSLYDSNCNYMGAPDGGITGRGDGTLTDFRTEVKNKKIVWENGK